MLNDATPNKLLLSMLAGQLIAIKNGEDPLQALASAWELLELCWSTGDPKKWDEMHKYLQEAFDNSKSGSHCHPSSIAELKELIKALDKGSTQGMKDRRIKRMYALMEGGWNETH